MQELSAASILEIKAMLWRWGLLSVAAVFAMLGGFAAYVYQISKPDSEIDWTWRSFLFAGLLAYFLGLVFGAFIPSVVPGRDGWLLVIGFGVYPLLGRLEKLAPKLFGRFLS